MKMNEVWREELHLCIYVCIYVCMYLYTCIILDENTKDKQIETFQWWKWKRERERERRNKIKKKEEQQGKYDSNLKNVTQSTSYERREGEEKIGIFFYVSTSSKVSKFHLFHHILPLSTHLHPLTLFIFAVTIYYRTGEIHTDEKKTSLIAIISI